MNYYSVAKCDTPVNICFLAITFFHEEIPANRVIYYFIHVVKLSETKSPLLFRDPVTCGNDVTIGRRFITSTNKICGEEITPYIHELTKRQEQSLICLLAIQNLLSKMSAELICGKLSKGIDFDSKHNKLDHNKRLTLFVTLLQEVGICCPVCEGKAVLIVCLTPWKQCSTVDSHVLSTFNMVFQESWETYDLVPALKSDFSGNILLKSKMYGFQILEWIFLRYIRLIKCDNTPINNSEKCNFNEWKFVSRKRMTAHVPTVLKYSHQRIFAAMAKQIIASFYNIAIISLLLIILLSTVFIHSYQSPFEAKAKQIVTSFCNTSIICLLSVLQLFTSITILALLWHSIIERKIKYIRIQQVLNTTLKYTILNIFNICVFIEVNNDRDKPTVCLAITSTHVILMELTLSLAGRIPDSIPRAMRKCLRTYPKRTPNALQTHYKHTPNTLQKLSKVIRSTFPSSEYRKQTEKKTPEILKKLLYDPFSNNNWLSLKNVQHIWPVSRFFPEALHNPAQDMEYLGYRLATLSALPPSVPVSRIKLADAGFYFRGHGDEVTCYRCQGRYSGWRAGDNPLDVHRSISPSCLHILEMDRESSTFVSREPVRSEADRSRPPGGEGRESEVVDQITHDGQGSETLQQPDTTRHSPTADSLGASSERAGANGRGAALGGANGHGSPDTVRQTLMFPRPMLDLGAAVYPMYQDMASRRRSYPVWDERRAPPLDQMIMSGMFYAGYADCVRCFYCGVGLKSWEVTDDVWTEHIRWRPNCGYIRAIKEDNYIRQVLDRIRREGGGEGRYDPDRNTRASEGPTDGIGSSGGNPSQQLSDQQTRPNVTTHQREAGASSTASVTPTVEVVSSTPSQTGSRSEPEQASSRQPTEQGQPTEEQSSSRTTASPITTALVSSVTNSSTPSIAATPTRDAGPLQSTVGPRTDGNAEDSTVERQRERHERILRENQELSRRLTCKICHHNTINTIFLPCGHLVTCENCARTVTNCPLCRDAILGTAQVQME